MSADDAIEYVLEENNDGLYHNEAEETIEQIIQSKISPHVRKLREFMSTNDFVTEKGDSRTNIINNYEKKSYHITSDRIIEFYQLLEDCRINGRTMNYAERQETLDISHSGIMLDFDIYQRVSNRIVTERHLQRLCTRIAAILKNTLAFEPNEEVFGFHIFIISKPSVAAIQDKVKGTIYKDGYHFIIPEIRVIRGYKKFLIKEILEKGVIDAVLKDISASIIDIDKVLDANSAHVPVNFIGSAKAGGTAYPLTHAFRINMEIDEDSTMNIEKIDVEDLCDGVDRVTGEKINLVYELSLCTYVMEIDGCPTWLRKREFDYNAALDDKIRVFTEKRQHGLIEEEDIEDNDNEVDILALGNAEANYLKRLLGIIDISYATEYEKWFKVICAIANTNVRYKPLAIWFSMRQPNSWSPAEIERVWNEALVKRAGRDPVSKRSIVFWARQSSPERFEEIDRENYNQILARAVYSNDGKIEHADAAKVVHAMIGEKFACDSPKGDKTGRDREWYEFILPEQKHQIGEVFKWRREDDPDMLHNFIADHLPKIYNEQILRLEERKADAPDIAEQKYWDKVIKRLKDARVNLGNNAYQTNVVKQCQRRFRVRGFTNELDSYKNILGVGNGVLMLGTNPRLIQGFHEYKVSRYTHTKYIPYDASNPRVIELMRIFRDAFPPNEQDTAEFIMFFLSTWVTSYDSANLLLIIQGGGRNAKTWMLKMTHDTLGDAVVVAFRPELLTGPNEKANEANSAKMSLMGKNGGYCDEFNPGETWNSSRVKTFVNPNRQTGRDLHAKETNFRNTVNPIACTNHDINAPDTDYGFWRRILYYRAKMKFTENPDPANPYEKKVNNDYMAVYTADPEYQEAWLSILVHYNERLHREYGGNINNVPRPTIDRETESYRNRQDTINRFINQMIVWSPHHENITLDKVASAYINWYNRHVQQSKMKIEDIITRFEASKIHSHTGHIANGTKVLSNHRILESADDPLQDGERYLFVETQVSQTVTPGSEEDGEQHSATESECDGDEDVDEGHDNVDEGHDNVDEGCDNIDNDFKVGGVIEYEDLLSMTKLADRNTPLHLQPHKLQKIAQRRAAYEEDRKAREAEKINRVKVAIGAV